MSNLCEAHGEQNHGCDTTPRVAESLDDLAVGMVVLVVHADPMEALREAIHLLDERGLRPHYNDTITAARAVLDAATEVERP